MPKRSTRTRRNNKIYSSENISSNEESESSFDSEDSDCSEEDSNDELQELKSELYSQLNELVFYKIEMPSSSSNKKIILCIEKIIEIFNKIYCNCEDEIDRIEALKENKENVNDIDNINTSTNKNKSSLEDNLNREKANEINAELSEENLNKEKDKEEDKGKEGKESKEKDTIKINANLENSKKATKFDLRNFHTFEVKNFIKVLGL